jgi:3-polyprenyl-4-hydroxybenzoate decarboxylase
MRYDKKVVVLRSDADEIYDPESGEYITAPGIEITKFCHVHDLGLERTLQVFGRTGVGALVVHHQGGLIEADKVRVSGKEFYIISATSLQHKASYIVSEAKV